MILLKEVFNLLATGALSNTSMSMNGEITSANYSKIIDHINLGLTELSKRFVLAKGELKLYPQEDVNTYYLRSDRTGSVEEMDDYTYLEYDEDAPFEDNLIKLLCIYDDAGESMPINDTTATTLIQIFSHDTVVITPIDTDKIYHLIYQKDHVKIIYKDTLDPTKYELDIPRYILEPLLFFIAAQNFAGITSKTTEGTTSMGNTFLYAYENSCRKIEGLSLDIANQDKGQQFEKNGWV